jgi:hypothetical protein
MQVGELKGRLRSLAVGRGKAAGGSAGYSNEVLRYRIGQHQARIDAGGGVR